MMSKNKKIKVEFKKNGVVVVKDLMPKKLIKNCIISVIGEKIFTKILIIGAIKSANLSALFIAIVLGKTSPKIKINKVIVRVEYKTPFSLSPRKVIKKLVAKAVAKVFTRLFPNNSVPINFSFWLLKKLTIFAFVLFFFSNWCILGLETAVKAVSEPEKKADKKSKKIINNIIKIVYKSILTNWFFN